MFRRIAVATVGILAMVGLSACGGNDPLQGGDNTDHAIVIGSQDYYSNEIIAEIYAQALEKKGHKVDRQFRIGQREVYIRDIESGAIDLFPEYTGPLLQYWKPDTKARLADDVYAELAHSTPEGLRVLDQSPATDQDSYTVTRAFADKWKLATVEDLAKVKDPMTMGANSEAESRPNGPKGLKKTYGVSVKFTPIEDSGGPLTVKALRDGDIQIAIIYTADPSISANNLVSLTDTKGLFLASHVVPVASKDVDDDAAAVINRISAAMKPEDLIALNSRSVKDQQPPAQIAREWLEQRGM